MKNKILLYLFIFVYLPINSQVTDFMFLTGELLGARSILAIENYLFIAKYDKISIVDLTSSIPSITNEITGFDHPVSLAVKGNYLYFGVLLENRVLKFDYTQTNPSLIEVIKMDHTPSSIAFSGNELFIYSTGNNKLYKTDITDVNSNVSEVDLYYKHLLYGGDQNIAINGNFLYLSADTKLYVINLTTPTLEPSIIIQSKYTTDIAFDENNNLFSSIYDYSKTKMRENVDNISVLNTENLMTNNFQEVISDVYIPWSITISNNIMYIVHREEDFNSGLSQGKISKIDLSAALTINNFEVSEKINVFPNPSSNFLNISGLNKSEDYIIYDIIGKKIINGTIAHNHKINILHLANGLYFLKINNKDIIKFIKK
ncbi:T9SS type A sorting domain-containing protein [Polaribacter sp. NJDZ03]|uniref:T9SS type A sorting domain-containing protein n=1 Tax=Polaribacter sp. NJDZ03 TaxID=2855841 RepID=UPI001C49CCFA|nr:T9SS type A sorting domain-containing protein [Polaribacter sp. NJDZ03]